MSSVVIRTGEALSVAAQVNASEVRVEAALNAPAGGATEHNALTGRSAEDAHPIEAITGLALELDEKLNLDGIPTLTNAEIAALLQ